VSERCLCPDFELRGETYEIWHDYSMVEGNYLVNPRTNSVVDTESEFTPPLTNDELLAIYDYGKGF
jgi:hypothetical protein